MDDQEKTAWHTLLQQLLASPTTNFNTPIGGGFALLSADSDHTQSYVFQTARLTEIRGASMRLDALNWSEETAPFNNPPQNLRDILHKHGLSTALITADSPGCVVFAGGGSLLAVVPMALADTLKEEMEALYPRKTGVATLTAVYQQLTADDLQGKPRFTDGEIIAVYGKLSPKQKRRFAQSYRLSPGEEISPDTTTQQGITPVMRQQTLLLRQAKQAKTAAPLMETSPFARLCRSCGRRPVTEVLDRIAGEPVRYLCQICHENHNDGIGKKSVWNERFAEWYKQNRQQTIIAPKAKDLEEIGEASGKKGYVGFIYADGNSMGKWLETADSLSQYSHRSHQLKEAIETAVYTSLANHLVQDGTARPFEIITIGGDDALLIVPADAALPIARDLCQQFSAGFMLSTHPSMSAGVVLAQSSNPIYFLSDLARQLLKNAKRRTREIVKNKPGSEAACIDFMVLKSQSTLAVNLQDVRRSPVLMAENSIDSERCYLTGRPYSLTELDWLLNSTVELKKVAFSPGQLHQMRHRFQNGRFPGLFYYLYQRARLSPEHRQVITQIEARWGMVEPQGSSPWRFVRTADKYTEYDTPWLDMLELREFV